MKLTRVIHSQVITNSKILLSLEKYLSVSDKKKLDKISDKRKKIFITSRALLAISLKELTGNYNYKLGYNSQGKPFLLNNNYFFNISHSKESVFLIIANSECGIDCEQIRDRNYTNLIKNFFHPSEIRNIENSKNSLERFWSFWTIKEAMIKQQGNSVFGIRKLPNIDLKNNKVILDNKLNNKLNISTYKTNLLNSKQIVSIVTQSNNIIEFYKHCFLENTKTTINPDLLFKT